MRGEESIVGWYRPIDWYRPVPRSQVIQLDGGYTLNIYAEAQPLALPLGRGRTELPDLHRHRTTITAALHE